MVPGRFRREQFRPAIAVLDIAGRGRPYWIALSVVVVSHGRYDCRPLDEAASCAPPGGVSVILAYIPFPAGKP